MNLIDYVRAFPRDARKAAIAGIANGIGVSAPAVRHWINGIRGIPLDQCGALEKATNGQVRCEELRNDVQWLRDDAGTVTGYVVPVAAHPEPSAKVA